MVSNFKVNSFSCVKQIRILNFSFSLMDNFRAAWYEFWMRMIIEVNHYEVLWLHCYYLIKKLSSSINENDSSLLLIYSHYPPSLLPNGRAFKPPFSMCTFLGDGALCVWKALDILYIRIHIPFPGCAIQYNTSNYMVSH